MTPKFSIGDNVGITNKKNLFDKGYSQRWTKEVFRILKIQLTIPVTYKITDYNGEEIQGSFYEQELQKTSQKTFRIENVLKRQGDKSLVIWMGYLKSFNGDEIQGSFYEQELQKTSQKNFSNCKCIKKTRR